MEVILLDKIDKLGNLGDVCSVKPGYARNYLLPQGKALPASEESKKIYEERKAELEKQLLERQEALSVKADKAKDLRLSFARRASEEGKLYGSVSILNIESELTRLGVEVEKRQINMPQGIIRHTGEFIIELRFDADNVVEIAVEVVPETDE